MRVIGGEFRSRKLQSMEGLDVRPTSDKMRETLFNILGDAIQDAVFIDAYAGTGAVGIEAVSRGARKVTLIEKDRDTADLIKSNLAALKIGSRARVIRGSAAVHLPGTPADMVFIDPPYPDERQYEASMEALKSHPAGLVIVQHSSRFAMAEEYGPLRRTRVVKQGENSLSFYRRVAANAGADSEVAASPEAGLSEPDSAASGLAAPDSAAQD